MRETYQEILLKFGYSGPMTDEELTELIRANLQSGSGTKRSRNELVSMNFVQKAGYKKRSSMGRYVQVWELSSIGKDWFRRETGMNALQNGGKGNGKK